jgi:hypothetical protein
VIAAFARAWNVEDDVERIRLLTASCLPDAAFASAQGPTGGISALSTSIGEFRRAFPAAIVSFGRADEFGGFVRVARTAEWNNGQPALVGQDFAQLAEDGRIRRLVSFDKASSPPNQ